MGKRIFAILVFLLIALSFGVPAAVAGGGCHGGEFRDQRGVQVDLVSACFTPTVIRIDPGQRVTWTNKDSMPHTVTGASYQWGTADDLGQGQSVSFRFQHTGVYPYACLLHPGMVGAVVVGDGTSADTTSQGIVPVANTLPPAPPAAQPVAAPAASHGVSGVWRVAAIAGFGLFVAAALVLATLFALSRSKRAAAGA